MLYNPKIASVTQANQVPMHATLPEVGDWEFVPGPPASSLHVTLICFPHKPRLPTKLQDNVFKN